MYRSISHAIRIDICCDQKTEPSGDTSSSSPAPESIISTDLGSVILIAFSQYRPGRQMLRLSERVSESFDIVQFFALNARRGSCHHKRK